jgi:hypothetical protein
MKNVERGEIRYIFVAYLQPLVPKAKCFPLFVIESPSGIGNQEIQKKIDELTRMTQRVINRVFLASDGDSSHSERYHSFFEFWGNHYEQFGLERVMAELKASEKVFPLSDISHLGKNFRTRFLQFSLTFVFGDASTSINHDRVRDILGSGPPFTDLSHLGKMTDAHPLIVTRIQNIIELIDRNAIAEAIALLPLSLCFNAIRLETISRETRSDLLRISFFLVRKLHEFRKSWIDSNPETTSKIENRRITIFTRQWTIRFLNTVLNLLLCLDEYDDLALDRAGTPPLESFFGLVRMDAHDINTPNEMERTIAHTDIVKEAQRDLGLEEHPQHRINIGGVHIERGVIRSRIFHIRMPADLNPKVIAEVCLKAVHTEHELLLEEEQCWFFALVQYLKMPGSAAIARGTNNEINQRFIAGSGSQIRTHLVTH